MRWTLGLVLFLGGCLPDLGAWEVIRRDVDAGPRVDAFVDAFVDGQDADVPRPMDCTTRTPIGAGYREGFESGPGGWGVGGERSSWEWGAPASTVINRAAEGANVWMTGLSTPYEHLQDAYVVSPCLDATSAQHDLLITLSTTTQSEASFDRGTVEYSVNGGETWMPAQGERRLGWYNASSGWSGDADWSEGSTLLEGTAGQSRVQVRVLFHSDSSANGEGFAFDDVWIRPSTIDLAMEFEEAERCGYATATVTNVGGQTVTGYEIASTVDGVDDVQSYDSALAYLETRQIELGGALARSLTASVFSAVDENRANDAASYTPTGQVLGSGGYFSDFESDDGGFFVDGRNPSWEWGEPNTALFAMAASGSRAWMTNLDGDYNPSERSYIVTPCYDMRSLSRDPQLSFMSVFRTEMCCDPAMVEISIDGEAFRRLGNTTSGGTNWYNESNGWRGSSGAGVWRITQHPLTGAAGHEFVRFRFTLQSDGNTQADGFGVDDVQIVP